MKKKMTLERVCILTFVMSMACIMQYALAYVPMYWKNEYINSSAAVILSKSFAVLFPLCFITSMIIIFNVKRKRISEESYTQLVQVVAATGLASGHMSAYPTLADAGKKVGVIKKYPLFYPFAVFGYFFTGYYNFFFVLRPLLPGNGPGRIFSLIGNGIF
jgi:hypothetical protein